MNIKLRDIATIQTGIYAKPDSEGEIAYLQVSYFNENGELTAKLHPDLKRADINEKHMLKEGDVLFAAKGRKNFAAWYEIRNPAAVVSTSFFVIRLLDNFRDEILSEFLVWLINSPLSQNFLKDRARGTAIVSISKSVLEELELSIPDLKTQETILKITKLRKKEKGLKHQIEELKDNQLQQLLLNAL